MIKKFLMLVGIFLILALLWRGCTKRAEEVIAAACAPLPERGIVARNLAAEEGYKMNEKYQCIDLASYQRRQQESAQLEKNRQASIKADLARSQLAAIERAKGLPPDVSKPSLTQARLGFVTHVALNDQVKTPIPVPPADLYVRVDYKSAGNTLAAFVTPDPKDQQKHPAIIWLTGGDSNTLDNFWTPGTPENDQSAQAFSQAGIVMMFPTLRGGNTNAGAKEFFYGEVDDVLAAAEQLAKLPYVDAAQIYLGGHSTGGTLALLVAESSPRFKAVFSMGPVAEVNRYGPMWAAAYIQKELDVMARNYNPNANPPQHPQSVPNYFREEMRLRAPIEWMHGIQSPVYVFEGDAEGANKADFRELCHTHWANVHCLPMVGHNHFSYLQHATKRLAARIFSTPAGQPFVIESAAFER